MQTALSWAFRNYADGAARVHDDCDRDRERGGGEVARLLSLFQPPFFGARFDIPLSEDGA